MIGQNISIDRQDIGFQGQHRDKQKNLQTGWW